MSFCQWLRVWRDLKSFQDQFPVCSWWSRWMNPSINPHNELSPVFVSVACNCDPLGSLNGGICDRMTDVRAGLIAGQCRCKVNVEGERCEHCKEAHYGLSDEPEGCKGTKLYTTPAQRAAQQHTTSTQEQITHIKPDKHHPRNIMSRVSLKVAGLEVPLWESHTNIVNVCIITAFQRVLAVLWEHFLEEIPATAKQEVASVNVWWPDETVTSVWWENTFVNSQWHQTGSQTNQPISSQSWIFNWSDWN